MSNELGWGRPRAAKYSVYVTVFQSLLIGLLSMVIILVARNHFAIIFTDSIELQRAVAKLAWFLGITMLLNSVQPVISGMNVEFSATCLFHLPVIPAPRLLCLSLFDRCCYWRRMASPCGIYKLGLLLCVRTPSWLHTRLCSKFGSNGISTSPFLCICGHSDP